MKNEKLFIVIVICLICSISKISRSCTESPIAIFDYDNNKCIGETYNFDASRSNDPDGGPIVGYQWNFGPDAYDITGQGTFHASCKFHTGGSSGHTILLRVTDNEGSTGETSNTVFVRHPPSCQKVLVPYVKYFSGYEYELIFNDVGYESWYRCYCGLHYTTHHHYEYDHSDTPSGFPFYDELSGFIVESTDTDLWFCNTLYKFIDGYIWIEPATCEYNCFGYATGINVFIGESAVGIERILNDDYDSVFSDKEVVAYSSEHIHAIKVEDIYPTGFPKITKEKWSVSGIYLKVWPEGTFNRSSYAFYKKKP